MSKKNIEELVDLLVEAVANTRPMIVAIRYGCVLDQCKTPNRCNARQYCCADNQDQSGAPSHQGELE